MLPITIDVVDCPIELKITSREKGMLGTLCIDSNGVSYKAPKTKLPPRIRLNWGMIPKMFSFSETIGVADILEAATSENVPLQHTSVQTREMPSEDANRKHKFDKEARYAKAYSPPVEADAEIGADCIEEQILPGGAALLTMKKVNDLNREERQ